MKKAIKEYLNKFGTCVNEIPVSELDVWVDDHKCIKWGSVEYFIPENNSFYTIEDEKIYDHLIKNYCI